MKKGILLLLTALLLMGTMLWAGDTRERSGARTGELIPRDQNLIPYSVDMTYINDKFHYGIGTFNDMVIDTVDAVSASTRTILLPNLATEDIARGFVIRNMDPSNDFEWWLDTDTGDHRFILSETSQYVPTRGRTLFVKTATAPDLLLEFGK